MTALVLALVLALLLTLALTLVLVLVLVLAKRTLLIERYTYTGQYVYITAEIDPLVYPLSIASFSIMPATTHP